MYEIDLNKIQILIYYGGKVNSVDIGIYMILQELYVDNVVIYIIFLIFGVVFFI